MNVQRDPTRVDWMLQVVDHEKLVLLFINYIFFTFIIMIFLLFLMCITQTMSLALDTYTMMTLLAVSFILINIVVANYLVHTMQVNKEVKVIF